jgi:hypothetical protein
MSEERDLRVFGLLSESNFDAYDRERYGPVIEAGVARNGLAIEDVLAVTQDLGLWAICTTGIFRADLRGMFKKRIDVDDVIPYARIASVRVEPSSPHTRKLVVRDGNSKKLAQIDFSAAGPARTIEGAAAHCERILQIVEQARGRVR